MWKFSTFLDFAFYVLLLLALLPTVNSNETPTPRMCAVCLEKDCATGVRRIYPAGSDRALWPNANSQTAIQNCTMENLKPDAPCKMANGGLVQLADNRLHFEGIDAYGVRREFNSQILPCADLNLPPSSTPSPVIHTSTPAAVNISVADNKGIIIGSIIGIIIIIIFISIGVLIWMRVTVVDKDRTGTIVTGTTGCLLMTLCIVFRSPSRCSLLREKLQMETSTVIGLPSEACGRATYGQLPEKLPFDINSAPSRPDPIYWAVCSGKTLPGGGEGNGGGGERG